MKKLIIDETRDDLAEILASKAKAGFRLLTFDPRGEFPDKCVAARITGPGLPESGLPFCVPETGKEMWANRLILVLSEAWRAGYQSVPKDCEDRFPERPAGGKEE